MSSRSFLYCGSFAGGIYRAAPGEKGNTLGTFEKLPDTPASFFLAAHPQLPVIYSVDLAAGKVQAFAVDGEEGGLRLLNEVSSEGNAPCHLAVDAGRRKLVVANYNGGVSLFSILPDGSLSTASFVFLPEGSGPDPKRQDKPHPHGVTLADGLVYVADLGADRIQALRIERDLLTPEPSLDGSLAPGAGPRHFVLHASGRAAACVNELDNTVTAFLRDPATGRLEVHQSRSTLPEGFTGESWTAEIGFHPTRQNLLIATNRGHDSLALFTLDPATGALSDAGRVPAGGAKPQHFVFSPKGEFLFVANTGANHVALHQINPATGLPEPVGTAEVPEPMALLLR